MVLRIFATVSFVLGTFVLFPLIPNAIDRRGDFVRPVNGMFYGLVGGLIGYSHKGCTTVYDPTKAHRSALGIVPYIGQRKANVQVTAYKA